MHYVMAPTHQRLIAMDTHRPRASATSNSTSRAVYTRKRPNIAGLLIVLL
jgi:hypothetical protein